MKQVISFICACIGVLLLAGGIMSQEDLTMWHDTYYLSIIGAVIIVLSVITGTHDID